MLKGCCRHSAVIICYNVTYLTLCVSFRIKKGYPYEARVITRLMPAFLADFFPPQDIMNKVIGEFLSSQQPYPQLIAKVVFQVARLFLQCYFVICSVSGRTHSYFRDKCDRSSLRLDYTLSFLFTRTRTVCLWKDF